jgi:hypothetical protein
MEADRAEREAEQAEVDYQAELARMRGE